MYISILGILLGFVLKPRQILFLCLYINDVISLLVCTQKFEIKIENSNLLITDVACKSVFICIVYILSYEF